MFSFILRASFVGVLLFSVMGSVQASGAPVGFWKFEEGAGTTVSNSAMTSVPGVLTNIADPATATSGWMSTGAKGKALLFDGINDAINFGRPSAINDLFVHDVTISAWINPTSCNSVRHLAGKSNGGPVGFYLYGSGGSCNPRLDVYHSGTRATYIAAPNTISPNTWSHLTVTWSATDKTAKIYVNGTEVSYGLQIPGSGTYVSDALSNLTFGNWHSAAGAQFFQGGIDEVKIYDYIRTPAQILLDKNDVTATLNPVMLVRSGQSEYLARVQVPDAEEATYAEYTFRKVAKGVWNIQGLRILDFTGVTVPRMLANTASVWEYAGFLGVAGDPAGAANWGDYGSAHGDENPLSASFTLDGVDVANIPVGEYRTGDTFTIAQSLETLLPKNNSIVVGSSTLSHVFTKDGMDISHEHHFLPGYELYNFYPSLLPSTGALDGSGFNRAQIGTSTPYTLNYTGGVYNLNQKADTGIMYSTEHPYAIRLTLPSGGPDLAGDWSRDLGQEKFWLYDTAAGYAKFYVNWVSGGYPARIPATTSSHTTKYEVYLRN
ncbi:LamG domain-containing protein [Patescibacteria group bacterium]|nr:LamG domain-containing protein [Patescibacteria group bacterium]MBU1500485.1 LamG domain-containing protein [Patescibacteria group bacterium]MBU2080717.1 LamG domain-containing protein [Patescibacteria group bacterium]MBU2194887.1 LamG domain-containing protein [Patescibacteria group bacterium]